MPGVERPGKRDERDTSRHQARHRDSHSDDEAHASWSEVMSANIVAFSAIHALSFQLSEVEASARKIAQGAGGSAREQERDAAAQHQRRAVLIDAGEGPAETAEHRHGGPGEIGGTS